MRSLPAFCCGYTAFLFSIAEKRRWGNGKVSSIGTAQADSSERGPTGFSISVFGRFTVHFVCSVRTLQKQYPPISDKMFVNSRTPDIGKACGATLAAICLGRSNLIVFFGSGRFAVDGTLSGHGIAFQIFVVGGNLVDHGTVWQKLNNAVGCSLHNLMIPGGE